MLVTRTLLSWGALVVSAPFLFFGYTLPLFFRPPASVHAGPNTEPVFVPYPEGFRLLAVAEGSLRGTPVVRAVDLPETWNGMPLVPYRDAELVFDRLYGTVQESDARLSEMRRLATLACLESTTDQERALLDMEFVGEIEAIDQLAGQSVYGGLPFFDGALVFIAFEARPPGWEPVVFLSQDITASALALSGATFDLDTRTNACNTLNTIDTAMDSIAYLRSDITLLEQQVEDGVSDGGLIEIERLLERAREVAVQATDGTGTTAGRYLLDSFFQSDLQRIDRVAHSVQYDGIPLLDGETTVILGGPPPAHVPVKVELPDATREALQLSDANFDVRTVADASAAIVSLDTATHQVRELRRELEAARSDLLGLRPRSR